MRGLKSTIALALVLAGLGAYIYFVTWKKTPETAASKQEKVFTGVEADKVEEVKVTSDKGDVTTLKKENGAWSVASPLTAKADDSEAGAIANALSQLEMVRVVDENATDLKEYGLATPRVQLDFKAAGDKDYRHLFLGDKSPTGSDLFARRNDEKKVFLIPAFQETTLNKSTFDLRDKSILKLERDKIDGVAIDASGKKLEIAKENADWKITQPIQARADYAAVEGLIGRLQTAAMKSITSEAATPADLKKFGLDKPAVSVALKMGSARAGFAVGGKAEDNTIYAQDTSKPMVVVTVDSMLADELKKGTDDYRRKDIFEFRSFNANRIEFTRSGQTIVFEKVKGEGKDAIDKWRRTSPNAADADKDKVETMLNRLSNVRAASFVPASAKTGLAMPALTVAVTFDEGKKQERVNFGKVDNDVFAAQPNEQGAAKIDANDFNETTKALDELSK